MTRTISAEKLKEQKGKFVIIDVRESDELAGRQIDGSINIPLGHPNLTPQTPDWTPREIVSKIPKIEVSDKTQTSLLEKGDMVQFSVVSDIKACPIH